MEELYKILIVDDEPDVLQEYGNDFRNRGFQVYLTTNGIEALEKLHQTTIGVAIVDIRMPYMDGIELAQQIKQAGIETRIIILTGYADKENMIAAIKAGASDVFEKEILNRRELFDKVYSLLRLKRIVYVEGKHDVTILNIAWQKLGYRQPMPFILKESNPRNEFNSTGNVDAIFKRLSSVQFDSPHIEIGIFDHDDAGLKDGYSKLPDYFKLNAQLDCKISEHHKAAAFLLPVPIDKQKYADHNNLCLEFYFSEVALQTRTAQGQGLDFDFGYEEVKVRGRLIDKKPNTLLELRSIKDGKKVFAEQIVPTLDAAEFEPFRLIFNQIRDVIVYLENAHILK